MGEYLQLLPHPSGVYVCLYEPAEVYLFPARSTRCWHLNRRGELRAATPPAGFGSNNELKTTRRGTIGSTDGRHRAEFRLGKHDELESLRVVDRTTGAAVVSDMLVGHPSEEPSASTRALYFVGDTIFVRDSDAGPHEDILAFSIDAKIRTVLIGELAGGTISVIGRDRVAFADWGIGTISIYDTRADRLRTYRRRLPATPHCTDQHDELIVCGEDGAAARACCADLERRDVWAGSLIAPLADGNFAIIATGKRFGQVGVFDPRKEAITRTISLRCPTSTSHTE